MDETAMEILFDGKHGQSLKQGLNRLYKDKTLCDVTLTSSDGVDLQAHWLVLAAHSEFLRHVAVSKNVMQFMLSDTGSLKLNIESEILKMILDYLYTGELVVTKDTLHKIKMAAKVLQLSKALALMERSHLSGLGDQCYEAESKILQPTALPQTPVLEQQHLQRQEFSVLGSLTQSPASYGQVQSIQSPAPFAQIQSIPSLAPYGQVRSIRSPAPFAQVQSTASPVLYSKGHLQNKHYDNGSYRLQQPSAVFQGEASPLQPTIISVDSISDSQTTFSSPSFSHAYLHQRPHTNDSSHGPSNIIGGKDGVVSTQQKGRQQIVSMEKSPCREFSINSQDGGLCANTSQRVHSTDHAISHQAQIAYSEPSSEPGRRRSEPNRNFSDEGQIVLATRPGRPRNSSSSCRPVLVDQAALQRKRGRPEKVSNGLNLDFPKSQSSSANYLNLFTGNKRPQIPGTEKQMNQNESTGSFGSEAVSATLSQERSVSKQKGESSHLSAEVTPEDMTAQNDSVEVDLGLVKTEQLDAESDDLDYVIYVNPDTSDTDSCGQSHRGQRKGKARNCRARRIITSKLQKRLSHGSMSYYRLRNLSKRKYLLSQYVQSMCIWKTEMSPFQCKVCRRRFKHLSSLKYHCLSTHLSKVKRNLQIKALNPTQPTIQASMMEYNSVTAQYQTGSSRTPMTSGRSLTLMTKGKSLTRGTSQTPGSDGKAQRPRKSKSWNFVLSTISEGSGKELRISRKISANQDHTANNSLLQEDEHRPNIVSNNTIPSTTADSCSESEKHFIQENTKTKTKKLYNSPRYPCNNCAKPFHFRSNMLRHLKICKKVKLKDEKKPPVKVMGKSKEIASRSVVTDVKKSWKDGRANNKTIIKKYTNGTTCTLCNKTFSRVDTTRMHIRAVHFQQKRFTCVCKEGFSWSAALSAHKKRCLLINQ